MSSYFLTIGQNLPADVVVTVIMAATFVLAIMIFVLLLFMSYQHRTFPTTVFVIHFRRGMVKRVMKGGRVLKLPLLDEIITIPLTTQQLDVTASEDIQTRDGRYLKVELQVQWHVMDPLKAFNRFSWDENDPEYVNNMLAAIVQSEVRNFCFEKTAKDVNTTPRALEAHVLDKLKDFVSGSGISIEKITVKEITGLNGNKTS